MNKVNIDNLYFSITVFSFSNWYETQDHIGEVMGSTSSENSGNNAFTSKDDDDNDMKADMSSHVFLLPKS